MRLWLRRLHDSSFLVRRFLRWYRGRFSGFPNWDPVVSRDSQSWRSALRSAEGGTRVLMATSVGGWQPGTGLESVLAAALTLRGAEVHVLLCDAAMPACLEARYDWHRRPRNLAREGIVRDLCRDCFAPANRVFTSLGVHVHHYRELIRTNQQKEAEEISQSLSLDEIPAYRKDGVAVGEHALAGALRFYARGTLETEPESEFVLRNYLRAGLLSQFAVENLLDRIPFTSAVFHHGIYIPQGITGEVARSRGVRVVNWNPAYRKSSFIFSHGDTYHHTLMNEDPAVWRDMPWTSDMEERILTYLRSRREGSRDWIRFHNKPTDDRAAAAAEHQAAFDRPCIGMLTNVIWDAQLHYPANVFANMVEWVIKTISYFEKRKDLSLLIRVHPAEVNGRIRSRQPVLEEIRRIFSRLPDNVHTVPPESLASTYDLMERCDSVLVYGTKTGVELTALGIPVIVAGEAWIRNKGLTLDASSVDGYFRLLDRLPLGKRMPEKQARLARKYAYHFFFRRMIPIESVLPVPGQRLFTIPDDVLDRLKPGRDPGMEVICDGILKGEPFVYPAEELESRA